LSLSVIKSGKPVGAFTSCLRLIFMCLMFVKIGYKRVKKMKLRFYILYKIIIIIIKINKEMLEKENEINKVENIKTYKKTEAGDPRKRDGYRSAGESKLSEMTHHHH
jgi:hypothetical protein